MGFQTLPSLLPLHMPFQAHCSHNQSTVTPFTFQPRPSPDSTPLNPADPQLIHSAVQGPKSDKSKLWTWPLVSSSPPPASLSPEKVHPVGSTLHTGSASPDHL